MKVTTINGETLRKEFTAIEAAALKHAAEYCVEAIVRQVERRTDQK